MKKIAIFDLDGTLLNTLESIAYCGNIALTDYGIENLEVKKFADFIGEGVDSLIRKLTDFVKLPQDKFEEFKKHYLEIYKENGSYNIIPYEGINELIEKLKNSGIKIAILSNKPDKIVKDCVQKYFPEKFDEVYGQKEGIPVKPDTTRFFEILKKQGVSPNECIYCGDSIVDVQTGKNAGVLTLGAAWGFYSDKPFENADGILYSPLELLRYI